MQLFSDLSPGRLAIGAFFASLAGGLAIVHIGGVIELIIVTGMTTTQAAFATSTFIPGDIVKCLLSASVCHTVAKGFPDWKFAKPKV